MVHPTNSLDVARLQLAAKLSESVTVIDGTAVIDSSKTEQGIIKRAELITKIFNALAQSEAFHIG